MDGATTHADVQLTLHDNLRNDLGSACHGSLCTAMDTGVAADIVGRPTFLQYEEKERCTKKWSSLPTPLSSMILNMLAADAKQAGTLAAVTTSWHQHILDNIRFRELFDCRARTLVAALKAKSMKSITCKSAPYTVVTFMKIWLDLQFPDVVPYSAWRGVTQEQPSISHIDGKAVFLDVKKRLAAKEHIFNTALTLNRLSQWMNREETAIDKVNAVTVLFLVPQGLFWLALAADGWVDCGETIGRICGLAACIGGAACTTCAIVCQVHILCLKHRLRCQLCSKRHRDTLPTHSTQDRRTPLVTPGLIRDRCETLNLFRCACWACIILVSVMWLGFNTTATQILVAFAVLSSLLSVVSIGLWLSLQRSKAHFPALFKLWFIHQWAMTPFFISLAVAQFLSGWLKLGFVTLAAVAPTAVLINDAILLLRQWIFFGQLTLNAASGIAAVLAIELVVGGGLAILCGRCVDASWAKAVPLTVLSLPGQLPLLAILTSVVADVCLRSCRRVRTCCSSCSKRWFNLLSRPGANRSSKPSSATPSTSSGP